MNQNGQEQRLAQNGAGIRSVDVVATHDAIPGLSHNTFSKISVDVQDVVGTTQRAFILKNEQPIKIMNRQDSNSASRLGPGQGTHQS